MVRQRAAARLGALVGVLACVSFACAEIGTGPNDPAAIEMAPFPAPSVVIGDTLRDLAGNVAPVRAIVRNIRGEEIADAGASYLYADMARDSALVIDPATGIVRALRASTGTNGEARIAARFGSNLQVLRTIVVTTRPDSIDAVRRVLDTLRVSPPDTGRTRNTSADISVTVRHREGTTVTGVNAWPVRFELVSPANPTNDTTLAAFLVDEIGRPTSLDTTSSAGVASRRVRVRASLFPTGTAPDSIVVRAWSTYRGRRLAGDSAVRIVIPVRRVATP